MDYIGKHYCKIAHLSFFSLSSWPCSVEEVQACPSGNYANFFFSLLDVSNKCLSYILSLSLITSNRILSFSDLSSSPSDTFLVELGILFWKTVFHLSLQVMSCQIDAPSSQWLNRQWYILILFSTATLLHSWSLLHLYNCQNSSLSHFSMTSFSDSSTVYSLKFMDPLVSQDFTIFFIQPSLSWKNLSISQSGLRLRLGLKLELIVL